MDFRLSGLANSSVGRYILPVCWCISAGSSCALCDFTKICSEWWYFCAVIDEAAYVLHQCYVASQQITMLFLFSDFSLNSFLYKWTFHQHLHTGIFIDISVIYKCSTVQSNMPFCVHVSKEHSWMVGTYNHILEVPVESKEITAKILYWWNNKSLIFSLILIIGVILEGLVHGKVMNSKGILHHLQHKGIRRYACGE